MKVSGASHGQNISDFRFRYFQLPVSEKQPTSGLEIPTGSGKLPHAIARFELYIPKVSCSMTDHLKIDPIFKPVKVLLSIMLGRLRDATLERIQEIKMFIQSKGN